MNDVYRALDRTTAERAIVFVDACFSGAATHGRENEAVEPGARPGFIAIPEESLTSTKVFLLAASSPEQVSNAYFRARHGLFTYFLLQGFHESPPEADGSVSLKVFSDFVTQHVQTTADKWGRHQKPVLRYRQDPATVRLFKYH